MKKEQKELFKREVESITEQPETSNCYLHHVRIHKRGPTSNKCILLKPCGHVVVKRINVKKPPKVCFCPFCAENEGFFDY